MILEVWLLDQKNKIVKNRNLIIENKKLDYN